MLQNHPPTSFLSLCILLLKFPLCCCWLCSVAFFGDVIFFYVVPFVSKLLQLVHACAWFCCHTLLSVVLYLLQLPHHYPLHPNCTYLNAKDFNCECAFLRSNSSPCRFTFRRFFSGFTIKQNCLTLPAPDQLHPSHHFNSESSVSSHDVDT